MWIKSLSVTIQTKAIEQLFPAVLFIVLYKVALCFESVDEIQQGDHSNETSLAVLPCVFFHGDQLVKKILL